MAKDDERKESDHPIDISDFPVRSLCPRCGESEAGTRRSDGVASCWRCGYSASGTTQAPPLRTRRSISLSGEVIVGLLLLGVGLFVGALGMWIAPAFAGVPVFLGSIAIFFAWLCLRTELTRIGVRLPALRNGRRLAVNVQQVSPGSDAAIQDADAPRAHHVGLNESAKFELVPLSIDEAGTPRQILVTVGSGAQIRTIPIDLDPLSEQELERQMSEPLPVNGFLGWWIYRNRIVRVSDFDAVTDELILRMKHLVLSKQRSIEKLQREVQVLEKLDPDFRTSREPIPDEVRIFVWQRDQGGCVRCGSQERLEFDHIIPLAKGGGNTERNIQLLCERCNRQKGAAI